MQYSICSYSFNRMLAAGNMDIFQFIDWNKAHGFTQLDPWMKHLENGYADDAYIDTVKAAADASALPFGCVAVDGAHIYEPTAEAMAENRQRAYRWIDICGQLGAPQVRIDAGGRDVTMEQIFDTVVEGYKDIVDYASRKNVEVIIENHWGPTNHPDNVSAVLDAVDGLGLLFDSNNWAEGTQEYGWAKCAKYARLTHMKTFEFDDNGNEPTVDIAKCMKILQDAGYDGTWGIESCPRHISEEEGALKTLALMKKVLE